MIDRVSLYKFVNIDVNVFDKRRWHIKKNEDKGFTLYIKSIKGVKITYIDYNHKALNKLCINGRFINLSQIKNKVSNLDDIWQGQAGIIYHEEKIEPDYDNSDIGYDGDDNLVFPEPEYIYDEEQYEQDLYSVFGQINDTLYNLTKTKLNILDFKISNCEVCFNLKCNSQEEVQLYITIFNKIFIKKNNKKYMNFTLENDKPLYSSYYVKSKKQYLDNEKKSYTVNFYNKFNQLQNNIKQCRDNNKSSYITTNDLNLAQNILRFEVQCHYSLLSKISKDNNIDNYSRTFKNFINIDLCYSIIKDKYNYFIDKFIYCDFYSLDAAKTKVNNSNLIDRDKKNLINHMIKTSKNYKTSAITKNKYNKVLADLEIHYFFIPKGLKTNFLISPMKLLNQKIENIKSNRVDFEKFCEWMSSDDDKGDTYEFDNSIR